MWRLSVQMFGGAICVVFIAFAIFMFGFLISRLYIILSDIYKKRKTSKLNAKRRKSTVKTMIIAGSGGHTTEILKLVSSLSEAYTPRQYVVAETDKMSAEKIHTFEKCKSGGGIGAKDSCYEIKTIPRSREVKQSWFTTIGTTFYATLFSLPLVFSSRPDLILCNGPGTCVPLCFAGFLLTLFGIKRVTIVFIESICRVTSLSLSGRILYLFADQVLVQWPELQKHYPLTRYIGRTV